MIIDCHGHYTTTPPGVAAWRDAQKEAVAADPDHISSKGVMTCLLYTSPSPRDRG